MAISRYPTSDTPSTRATARFIQVDQAPLDVTCSPRHRNDRRKYIAPNSIADAKYFPERFGVLLNPAFIRVADITMLSSFDSENPQQKTHTVAHCASLKIVQLARLRGNALAQAGEEDARDSQRRRSVLAGIGQDSLRHMAIAERRNR